MMMKLLAVAVTTAFAVGVAVTAFAGRGNNDNLGEVYVTSQGLYYDTFVTVQMLPPVGPFQKLEAGATEFGPGDPGYLAGRWWIDNNHNNEMDAGDDFVLCPLLPPGRPYSNEE